jgi:uncharacterized membrane protein HdeD (DUF308 family)
MVELMPKRRGWRLGLGLTMVVLGVLSLAFTPAVSVISTVLLGIALATAGGVALIAIFKSESAVEGVLMLILGGMLVITGFALLLDPVRALTATTTIIGTYLLFSGVARIIIALFNRHGPWGWAIVHGVVNLLLGVLIFAKWPLSGLVAVGLFVAIELIIIGVSWTLGARAARPQPSGRAARRRRSAHASSRG